MKSHSNFEVTKNDDKKERASELICHFPLVIVLQRIDSKFKCCPLIDRIQLRIGFFFKQKVISYLLRFPCLDMLQNEMFCGSVDWINLYGSTATRASHINLLDALASLRSCYWLEIHLIS